MFEHDQIDGKKIRVISAEEAYTCGEILELRDTVVGKSENQVSRLQYTVVGNLLVQRFLPPESIGDCWEYDSVATPWWEVVSHPPHAGVVADFNKAHGGLYIRELNPAENVVGFASGGEPVLMVNYEYTVASAAEPIITGDIRELRNAYYAQKAAAA